MTLENTCALCKNDVEFVEEKGELSTRQDYGRIRDGWYWGLEVHHLCAKCADRLSAVVKSESRKMESKNMAGIEDGWYDLRVNPNILPDIGDEVWLIVEQAGKILVEKSEYGYGPGNKLHWLAIGCIFQPKYYTFIAWMLRSTPAIPDRFKN